jgi:hypothetical protein
VELWLRGQPDRRRTGDSTSTAAAAARTATTSSVAQRGYDLRIDSAGPDRRPTHPTARCVRAAYGTFGGYCSTRLRCLARSRDTTSTSRL